MPDLYNQWSSGKYAHKYGRVFTITLLLFILLAIVYAVIVYQSDRVYNRHSKLFWGLAESYSKADTLSRKDTVYVNNYSAVADSLKAVQQNMNTASANNSTDEDNNNVSFVDKRLTAEGEELIIKKIRSIQKQNNITNKFVTICEYPGISERDITNQVTKLLERKGYAILSELEVITDVPNGIAIGRNTIDASEYGVAIYIGVNN